MLSIQLYAIKKKKKVLRMEAGENYPIKNSQTHELLGYTDRQEDRQEERQKQSYLL